MLTLFCLLRPRPFLDHPVDPLLPTSTQPSASVPSPPDTVPITTHPLIHPSRLSETDPFTASDVTQESYLHRWLHRTFPIGNPIGCLDSGFFPCALSSLLSLSLFTPIMEKIMFLPSIVTLLDPLPQDTNLLQSWIRPGQEELAWSSHL
jgi:hypothetical protein